MNTFSDYSMRLNIEYTSGKNCDRSSTVLPSISVSSIYSKYRVKCKVRLVILSMKSTWYQYLKMENSIRLLASNYIRESERTVHLQKKSYFILAIWLWRVKVGKSIAGNEMPNAVIKDVQCAQICHLQKHLQLESNISQWAGLLTETVTAVVSL